MAKLFDHSLEWWELESDVMRVKLNILIWFLHCWVNVLKIWHWKLLLFLFIDRCISWAFLFDAVTPILLWAFCFSICIAYFSGICRRLDSVFFLICLLWRWFWLPVNREIKAKFCIQCEETEFIRWKENNFGLWFRAHRCPDLHISWIGCRNQKF